MLRYKLLRISLFLPLSSLSDWCYGRCSVFTRRIWTRRVNGNFSTSRSSLTQQFFSVPSSSRGFPSEFVLFIEIFHSLFLFTFRAEEYKFPRTTIHIRLLRNFLLEITIVSALLMFWITRNSELSCWETTIGQEVYRILIIDFFIHTICTCCYYFVRYLIHKWVIQFVPENDFLTHSFRSDPDEYDLPEFDITHSSLGLVFNQFILWVGLPFSPVLSILSVMKFVFIFYIMKFTLIKCCKAPVKLWKSKQIQTFFLVGIFTTLVGVFVTIGLVITKWVENWFKWVLWLKLNCKIVESFLKNLIKPQLNQTCF